MSIRTIPDSVSVPQQQASDPALSAWVAANAGSGKTHVLAQRVIRLLLAGTDPSKILCITFTKAAAANMATRVFNTLSAWTALGDDDLDARIREIGHAVSPSSRERARRLFALALETPGGLKVQTIHAFCTRLLHQFPFEADVAARFTVLDDFSQQEMLDRNSLAVMLDAAANPDTALGRALAAAVATNADQTFREVVQEAIKTRHAMAAWVDHAGSVDAAIGRLSDTLGLSADDREEAVEAAIIDESEIAATEWPELAAALAAGSSGDKQQSERFARLSATSGTERLETFLSIYCTAQDKPRARLTTRDFEKKYPDLEQRLGREQLRVCALLDRRRAIRCRDRSAALLRIADAVVRRYLDEKSRRGVLDYEDLIDKTLGLLRNTSAAWVLYKLDLGIDHLLIDEAQDTSPAQWDIIRALVSEFHSGAGARGVKRTLFAVGDDKQSIFSFQGAEPQKFDAMRREFAKAFQDAALSWCPVNLRTSFRSGPAVLGAVDHVFALEEARRGLSADPVPPVHEALPDALPGNVEIWAPTEPDQRPAIEAWDAPFDIVSETSPRVKLGQRIARHVAGLIARGAPVRHESGTRSARPGDVLVLVRQRGPLFEAIIRSLKERGVPVAGADRLVLTEHIAVMDLMALADALLLRSDDLALATVLKSPLFGLSESELFDICRDRGEQSVLAALTGRSKDNPRFDDAAARLNRCAAMARAQTPFGFYAWLLGPEGGRRRMLARLGAEAADALDEFLNLALEYERREAPSLQGFVSWLRAASAEVKRDMEHGRDEVRVMTVHGAKGLEAPIVILADTMTRPEGAHPPRLLRVPDASGGPDCIVWAPRRQDDTPVMQQARDVAIRAARDEYSRLLYVAMTRAADRLIVCGADGLVRRPENCWYDLVCRALQPLSVMSDKGDFTVWHYLAEDAAPAVSALSGQAGRNTSLPGWLSEQVAADPDRAIALTPSGALESGRVFSESDGDRDGRRQALERGRAVHRLMQSLPDIPHEARHAAAAGFLGRQRALAKDQHKAILGQVFGVLDDPRFAGLFGPGSRAEVPIVGKLTRADGRVLAVTGQVDRLVVTPEAVLIADYKTNRPAPGGLADVPPAYIGQLSLYRGLLARLFGDRPVRAALVWTDTVDLMEIPASALDAALAAILSRVTGA